MSTTICSWFTSIDWIELNFSYAFHFIAERERLRFFQPQRQRRVHEPRTEIPLIRKPLSWSLQDLRINLIRIWSTSLTRINLIRMRLSRIKLSRGCFTDHPDQHILLVEGHFWHYQVMLGAPTITLGAYSNTQKSTVETS